MNTDLMDMFVPKECLVDKPWKVENREVWANCADKRAMPKAIASAIFIVVFILILALVAGSSGYTGGAVFIVVLGLGLAAGSFFFNKWYFRRNAELDYDRFEQDFNAYKRTNPEGTFATYQQMRIQQEDLDIRRQQVAAQSNAALAQQGANTAILASLLSKK